MENEKLKMMDINDFILFGEGGTSFTYNYKNDDNVMLKLFKDEIAKEEVMKEYEINKKIQRYGFIIPKVLELVNVNNKIGILFEKIKNKTSLSRMMTNDNSKIDFCAKEMAIFSKKLHTTKCDVNIFPNKKEDLKIIISKLSFSNEIKILLNNKLSKVEDEDTCLHGDLQPSNFIYANDKVYMIDLGNFSYGNHMFDIGTLYFACCVIITEKEKIDIFHMSLEDLKLFFDTFAKYYIGEDEEKLKNFYKEAKEYAALCMGLVFHIQGEPEEKKLIYENKIKQMFN